MIQDRLYGAAVSVCEGVDIAHVPVRLCAPLCAAYRLGAYR